MTEDGLQLSDRWCDKRLDAALGFDRQLANEIRATGFKKLLLTYDPQKRAILDVFIP
jgi:hypothetical protein